MLDKEARMVDITSAAIGLFAALVVAIIGAVTTMVLHHLQERARRKQQLLEAYAAWAEAADRYLWDTAAHLHAKRSNAPVEEVDDRWADCLRSRGPFMTATARVWMLEKSAPVRAVLDKFKKRALDVRWEGGDRDGPVRWARTNLLDFLEWVSREVHGFDVSPRWWKRPTIPENFRP